MRTVLLVGGAGYIGSVLTQQLLRSDYSVKCLDLLLYGNEQCVLPFLDDPNYTFIRGDLCDSQTVREALKGVTDVVVLAGLVGDPITKKYPDASQKINNDGMSALISAFSGHKLNRVVFISTCSNYGLIGENELADENFALNPLSLYAKAKVEMEQKVLSLRGKVDFCPTVLRFATAFGLSPRMRFDLTVSEFVRAMYLGQDLLVYDADTWRPYCHVIDLSTAIQKTLEAPAERVSFEVFNVGGDSNNFTKRMIVEEARKILPNAPVRYKEHGTDPRNYRVNFKKIRDSLGFEPKYSVAYGVQSLVASLKRGFFRNVESNRNFYGNYEITYPQK